MKFLSVSILFNITLLFGTANIFAQPADLLSAIAKAEFEKQNFAPCITEMSKLILAQSKNDTALVERARCLYLSADDTNDEKVILAEISKKILDKAKAESAASAEMMSRRNRAVDDATKAIAINPKNANAFNIRGLVKSSLGMKDRAESIADFDKAIELNPLFIKPYFNRGETKADMSDYDGAIADFTKVIEFDPNNTAAMENRVAARIAKNQGKPSIELFNELKAIIKLSPTREKNYYLAGTECFKFPYKFDCVDFFKQYTAAFPKSFDAFIGLARANASVEFYYDIENKTSFWKDAELAFKRANELKPKDFQPFLELFELRLEKFRDYKSAASLSQEALTQFPTYPDAHIMVGRVAMKLREYDKAVAAFSRSIELNPGDGLANAYRGDAYRELNNFDNALADLNKAIELDPYNGKAFMYRGNLFVAQKKYQDAIASFTEADNRKETCAKTYRGVVYGKTALDSREQRDTGNFIKARNDFLADDGQKCYDTHFQYGMMLYAQRFDKEAAEQFDYALTAYKKFNYNTAEIVERQNKLKIAVATSQVNSGNSGSDIEQLIAAYKAESINQGATLLGSGVYDYSVAFDPAMKFNVTPGETYVFVAIKDYDPTFGYDVIYNDRFIMRPTHRWDDNAYEIPAAAEYSMKFDNSKVKTLSVLQINLYPTKKSPIRTIQFSQSGKVSNIYWLCFKLK